MGKGTEYVEPGALAHDPRYQRYSNATSESNSYGQEGGNIHVDENNPYEEPLNAPTINSDHQYSTPH